MLHQLLGKISPRYRFFLLFLILIALPFGIWRAFLSEPHVIPEKFSASRRESALIAEQIVALSGQSVQELEKIQALEKKGKYYEALDLTTSEIRRVSELREKGVGLLERLGEMTKAVEGIKPVDSRSAALQAINYETAIVNHLMNYSAALEELLRLIASHLVYGENIEGKFEGQVKKINNEIKAIDYLNSQFNAELDKLESRR